MPHVNDVRMPFSGGQPCSALGQEECRPFLYLLLGGGGMCIMFIGASLVRAGGNSSCRQCERSSFCPGGTDEALTCSEVAASPTVKLACCYRGGGEGVVPRLPNVLASYMCRGRLGRDYVQRRGCAGDSEHFPWANLPSAISVHAVACRWRPCCLAECCGH